MPAGAPALGRKRFLCCASFSMTSIQLFDAPLLARSVAWGEMKRASCSPVYLREEPSAEIIDAVVPIADEECAILLGRIARAMPDLSEAALDALDAIDDPRAKKNFCRHFRKSTNITWSDGSSGPAWNHPKRADRRRRARFRHNNGKP